MGGHRPDVTPRDRAGQARLALVQGSVQGRREQGAESGRTVLDPGGRQHSDGLRHHGQQVVGAVGEGCVVDRARRLLQDEGLPAELDHQRLRDRQHRRGRSHSHWAADEPGHIRGEPGEGHRRVDRQRDRPAALSRGEHGGAVAPRGVGHQLARLPAPQVRQALDERPEGVVGDGQQDQLGALDDLLDLQDRHTGKQHLGTLARLLRDRVDADDLVLHRPQRAAQDRPDAPGGDDADAQPARPARAGWGGRGPVRVLAACAWARAIDVAHAPMLSCLPPAPVWSEPSRRICQFWRLFRRPQAARRSRRPR